VANRGAGLTSEPGGWEYAGARAGRPYVLLSAAVSLDGYLDDDSPNRLVLSDDDDWDRVDALRAGADAIMVGANTVRRDNPRLLVRSAERRADRVARGVAPNPARVTVSAGGGLDPAARIFGDEADTLVYRPAGAQNRDPSGARVEVVDLPRGAAMPAAVAGDLFRRGVRRLMIEGGQRIHTAFLLAGLVDEIQIVTAPFLVGAAGAPRFVGPGRFPRGPGRPMRLAELRRINDLVLARYLLDEPTAAGGG